VNPLHLRVNKNNMPFKNELSAIRVTVAQALNFPLWIGFPIAFKAF